MPRVVWLTVPEYADYVGMTPQYIRKVIHNGKITKKSLKRKGARSFLVNPKRADSDLLANTSYVNKKAVKHNGKETKKQLKKETQKKPVAENKKKATIRSAGLKIVPLAEAQKMQANYMAALKKLEFQEKKKRLVNISDVEKNIADLVLSARNKILAIKGILAPLLKEFIDDAENFGIAMENIDNAIRDILRELAGVQKE